MVIEIIAGLLVVALCSVYAAYLAADRETITAENFRDGSGYEAHTMWSSLRDTRISPFHPDT